MKLRVIGPNQTEVEINDKVTVFFSYETPVAAWIRPTGALNRPFIRTTKRWSSTTTRHINKWLNVQHTRMCHKST